MLMLSAALLFLVASHVVPSQAAVRGRLVARLGRGTFLAAYSLVSVAALALVIAAYRSAGTGTWLWYPVLEGRYAALAAMPVAILLLVCRLTQDPSRMAGIYRITTTPGSLGVLLWSLVHLLNVGETRTVAVFVGMAAIAAASLLRNAMLARPRGAAGAVPFARILSGSERFAPAEIGVWRLLLAAAVTASLVHLHPLVIGPDPLAGVL
ncbi:NnrU family protein [Arenibaculum sp.]|uniref:NnrU family protein n=1 Tax=Arenibaculum sp. TaxID=2865862 RepID=UPI002E100C5B|nr:NnrU family protein [Arenibaculum sp.]